MDCYAFGVEETVRFIAGHIELSSAKILDIGAGRGRLSKRLREFEAEVTAIDKSSKAIEFAANDGIAVYTGDICGNLTSPFKLQWFPGVRGETCLLPFFLKLKA